LTQSKKSAHKIAQTSLNFAEIKAHKFKSFAGLKNAVKNSSAKSPANRKIYANLSKDAE